MEKKLPKVFANPLDHKIENNKEVFYSQNEGGSEIITSETIKESSSIKIEIELELFSFGVDIISGGSFVLSFRLRKIRKLSIRSVAIWQSVSLFVSFP